MELIKGLLAIAAALFAFTVTFGPTLKPIAWKWAMWMGWSGLAVSMVGGLVHLLGWDHFYKSYLDINWRRRNEPDQKAVGQAGDDARDAIDVWRRAGMSAQFAGFVVGVAGVGLFAGANIENAAAKVESTSAAAQCCCQCDPAATAPTRAASAAAAGSNASAVLVPSPSASR
ncbi:hypothetical protein [Aquincola sp. J276]|uniref:hypothetical protein n=1 Tax=Aquincola sp. J276 TaxID=2898432 RepID=UPI002150AC56|nr:hypothetical protein [Aquincola sp. J276]MCR5868228.1 hypothetical protein [Aquincola sp. J276]